MRTDIRVVLLFVLVILPLGCFGCADLNGAIAQTAAWRDEAILARDGLSAEIDSLSAQRSAADPNSTESQALDSAISIARAKRASLDAAIAHAQQVLNEAQQPSDALTQIAHGISAWVPAPAQGPLVLGAALIATLARSRQLKLSSASIINSISHVLERDDQFKASFTQHADTIRSIQTPTARRLVDQTLRKRVRAE